MTCCIMYIENIQGEGILNVNIKLNFKVYAQLHINLLDEHMFLTVLRNFHFINIGVILLLYFDTDTFVRNFDFLNLKMSEPK